MKATIVVNGVTRTVSLYKYPIDRMKKSSRPNTSRWITLNVNGQDTEVKVTSNRAWAGGEKWIEYPWFAMDGHAWWFALDYLERAEAVESVVTSEGSATKFTKRITARTVEEQTRIAMQRRTWYERRGTALPDDLTADLKRLGLLVEEQVEA